MKAERESSLDLASNATRALLGKCLHDWRKSQRLPLKHVGRKLGVSEGTWSRWEKGTRFPLRENLRLLAEFIGTPICEFFYADGQDSPVRPFRDGGRNKPCFELVSCQSVKKRILRSPKLGAHTPRDPRAWQPAACVKPRSTPLKPLTLFAVENVQFYN